jgi:crotonobetainyl-CoA:carnitine CoA-transferase CaiB-like acyl-CoA transferase
VTIPTQPEPADATRFATRPKQRRKELVNATDNTLTKLRKETVKAAMDALLAGSDDILHAADLAIAHRVLEEGMWRQWVEDDRTLDAETVAEQFTRAEHEYSAAIHNRAVIRQYGVAP